MRTWHTIINPNFLPNGFQAMGQTLVNFYQTTKDIFSDEPPFFLEAEKEAGYQRFQAWCSDLKQTLRADRKAIEAGGVDVRLFRENLLAHQESLQENIVSPFYYQQQLTALEEKLKQQSTPVIPKAFFDVLREAKAQLRKQLEMQPEVTESYFYNDLINRVIESAWEHDIEETLRELLMYYKNLVEENVYQSIEKTLEGFIESCNAYYQEEENSLNPLPDRWMRQILRDINLNFMEGHAEKSLEAEKQKSAFVIRFSDAILDVIQESKVALQSGLEVVTKPKTLATIGIAAALGYSYSISGEEGSSNRFRLNKIAFPSFESNWPVLFYQTTNFISTFAVTYGINTAGGHQAFVTPVSMVVSFSSLLQPIVAEPMQTIKSDGQKQNSNEALLLTKRQGNGVQPIVSTPLHAYLVGSYNTSGIARGIALSGNFAYVADDTSGLQIVNVSMPSAPTLAGNYDTSSIAYSVALSGNLAYVATSSGLQIVDISTPSAPTLVGNYATPGQVWGVVVSGNLTYLADYDSGLRVIDVSTPSAPTFVGNYDTPGTARDVVVSGEFAYVADDNSIQVLDMNRLSTFVGNYDTPGNALNIAISGNLTYVADGSSGLQIIDVSMPSAPTLVGNYDTPGLAYGVVVSGNFAYVADYDSGLQIVDVSTPSAPTLLGNYDTPGPAYGIAVSGNFAYVADDISGLQIVDVSTPSAPTLVGNYDTPSIAYSVKLSGNLAYVATSSGLQIVDVSTPSAPTLVGNYDTPGNALDVVVSGNLAYVTDYNSGLQIIDVSMPSAPTLVGNYDTPSIAYSVAVSGNLAYVADYSSGLQIVDVSTPSAPTFVGNYDTPGQAWGVVVSGNLAYVADYSSGLQIVDVSTTASPLVSSYTTPGNAISITLFNNLAYVADSDSGLQILDISIPSMPILVGSYNTPGSAQNVVVSGNLAYIADGTSGFQIVDVSTSSSSTLAGYYDTSGTAYSVAVSGNLVYVADGSAGLQVIAIDAVPTSSSTTESETGSNATAWVVGFVLGGGALLFSCLGGLLAAYYYKKRQTDNIEHSSMRDILGVPLRVREDKGWTKIRAESGRQYALVNKISKEEARLLETQTGIAVTFISGKKKTDFTLGSGQFGKLRLGKILSGEGEGTFVGVKKIKGPNKIAASKQEATLQTQVSEGPHIMPLLDAVETTGSQDQPVLYQFMPLAGFGSGEDLQQKIKLAQSFDPAWLVLQLTEQLLEGLAYLHKQGIAHLDFKLSNIVLDKKGAAYLIDFGCAQQMNNKGLLTESIGDTRYFSPERLSFHRGVALPSTEALEKPRAEHFSGSAADLWALGVSLIELQLGRYPFEGCSSRDKLYRWDAHCLEEKIESALTEIEKNSTHSEERQALVSLLRGLLATAPEQRFTARQALAHPYFEHTSSDPEQLKGILQQLEVQSRENQLSYLEEAQKKVHVPKIQDENYVATSVYHYETGVDQTEEGMRDVTTLFGAQGKSASGLDNANDTDYAQNTNASMYMESH